INLLGFCKSTFLGTFEATASITSRDEIGFLRFSTETLNVSPSLTVDSCPTTAFVISSTRHGTTFITGFTFRTYLNFHGLSQREVLSLSITWVGSRPVFAIVNPLTVV